MVFPDVETRDVVRAAAPKLAGKKNMGMCLEIPESLRPNLRALESMSYMLKQSHPTLKRNIKYDDEEMDLVMDVKLNESALWKKIRPDQAKEAKRGRALPSWEDTVELNSSALQSMLSTPAALMSLATGANATLMEQ